MHHECFRYGANALLIKTKQTYTVNAHIRLLIKSGTTTRSPGKNCRGYNANVKTGKYNTLDNSMSNWPMTDSWPLLTSPAMTDSAAIEIILVKNA